MPVSGPGLRMDEQRLRAALPARERGPGPRLRRGPGPRRGRAGERPHGLLAYPAQSNFTGVQHPLTWIAAAQARGYDVLLDAAAYVPANTLDLSRYHPDFTVVSWYKVFGHPTGVGSLIARRDALARLRRPWFSGGTIYAVSAQAQWHVLADDEAAFEDGTVNFLSVPDVTAGLEWIDNIGMDRVHAHVTALTGQLLAGLRELRHSDGSPLVRTYGPVDLVARGGTVALNLLGADGGVIDERVAASATRARARRRSPWHRVGCARQHAAKSRPWRSTWSCCACRRRGLSGSRSACRHSPGTSRRS
ncbi:aminotransferase class V-fold PLP-dependent enzyme [Streptomyces phaeochromogenes]|uniref:aminotransferase class V-fold PLP-dependent enzyme n=1 Tax=Streptomyces phaeochromogenes TaxID=1923 RepID=UPI0033D7659D